MQQLEILALHGFLGQGSDWLATENALNQILMENKTSVQVRWVKPDLFSPTSNEINEFEEYVETVFTDFQESCSPDSKKLFIGYSLGGRLGLHLLGLAPEQFDRFIFVSTNPGFTEAEKKNKDARLMTDMKWAHSMSEQNWSQFLKEWNSQPVFSESFQPEPVRECQNYDLKKLKKAIVIWSLSQQEDFRDLLAEVTEPVRWVVGRSDSKYFQLAEQLKQEKCISSLEIIEQCGHRILFDQPTKLAQLISKVI